MSQIPHAQFAFCFFVHKEDKLACIFNFNTYAICNASIVGETKIHHPILANPVAAGVLSQLVLVQEVCVYLRSKMSLEVGEPKYY